MGFAQLNYAYRRMLFFVTPIKPKQPDSIKEVCIKRLFGL